MFFVKANNLPKELTSYDLLKSLAVILMIVDHVGTYLLPEQAWWRMAASSVPIWFFFVGYASSRNLTPPIWAGAIILIMADIVMGTYILPLSILATIIVARAVIDPLMKVAMHSKYALILICVVFTLIWYPSRYIVEYGTMALLIAMYGWMVRREKTDLAVKAIMPAFTFFVMALFIATHVLVINFTQIQALCFIATTIVIFGLTMLFQPKILPDLTVKSPSFLVSALQIMGRYSLYLYVGHVVLFMIIAYFTGVKDYQLFNWRLMY